MECKRCGMCCHSYLVGITAEDVLRLCENLNIKIQDFFEKFLDNKGNMKYRQTEGIGHCIFYNPVDKCCIIYGIRPSVCKDYTCSYMDP